MSEAHGHRQLQTCSSPEVKNTNKPPLFTFLYHSLQSLYSNHPDWPCGLQQNLIFFIIIRPNIRKLSMLRCQEIKYVKRGLPVGGIRNEGMKWSGYKKQRSIRHTSLCFGELTHLRYSSERAQPLGLTGRSSSWLNCLKKRKLCRWHRWAPWSCSSK